MSRRRKVRANPIEKHGSAPISGKACDIAVSEITGIPLDDLCGFVILAARHLSDGRHQPVMVPCNSDLDWALTITEQAAADLRLHLDGTS